MANPQFYSVAGMLSAYVVHSWPDFRQGCGSAAHDMSKPVQPKKTCDTGAKRMSASRVLVLMLNEQPLTAHTRLSSSAELSPSPSRTIRPPSHLQPSDLPKTLDERRRA
ncbi:hypothetical protein Sjap_013373 [Stephania japonica]|uniref:Uncharacterized protein n=1 Tax=Stephania japonica TaxID=461633 RepID=A0AAP0IXT1_9MAGN